VFVLVNGGRRGNRRDRIEGIAREKARVHQTRERKQGRHILTGLMLTQREEHERDFTGKGEVNDECAFVKGRRGSVKRGTGPGPLKLKKRERKQPEEKKNTKRSRGHVV